MMREANVDFNERLLEDINFTKLSKSLTEKSITTASLNLSFSKIEWKSLI